MPHVKSPNNVIPKAQAAPNKISSKDDSVPSLIPAMQSNELKIPHSTKKKMITDASLHLSLNVLK